MDSRQVLVVIGVVVVATVGVVVPAASAGMTAAPAAADAPATFATATDASTLQTSPTNATANDTQMGTQVAAFMQSNAAQVDDTVDNGMWEAAFERANESQRARMARARAQSLDANIADVAERNRTLAQQYENGSISYAEYVVAASRLNGEVAALTDGVDGTARAAERAGVNVTELDELRRSAGNLTGPEIAGIARGLVDDRGPPTDVPGQGPPGENETDGPRGPPTDRGDGNGPNATTGPGNGGPDAGTPGNATAGDGGPGEGEPGEGNPGEGEPGEGNPGEGEPGSGGDSGNATSGDGGPGAGGPGNGGLGDEPPGNGDGADDNPGNADGENL